MKKEFNIREEKSKSLVITLLLMIIILNISSVFSESLPEGPTNLTVVNSSRRTPAAGRTIEAIAGNVTQLNIVGTTVTQTWAGYYGNISGTITLDDSSNNTLYDWVLTNPEGEIYASESAIDFSYGNIECYNYTKTGGSYLTLSSYETSLGLAADDADGINETFALGTTYDSFYAGTNLIDGTCPETQLFNSSGSKNSNQFQEVLLYDDSSNKVVYTAILEETGILGFNNERWDFEMIVSENGHTGDTTTTTYYFYVELE
jgi:hypothetical protein